MTQRPFNDKLHLGKDFERRLQRLRLLDGWTMQLSEKDKDLRRRGPVIHTPAGTYVAPDFLATFEGRPSYEEAKWKAVASFYRKTKQWQTCIDAFYYDAYFCVQEATLIQVSITFGHQSTTPCAEDLKEPDCPATAPSGVYRNSLNELQSLEPRFRPDDYGGMYYWNVNDLTRLMSYEEFTRRTDEEVPLRRGWHPYEFHHELLH